MLVLGFAASTAAASQIISTSTITGLTFGVNDRGEAMLSYISHGRTVHVLAWGAQDAVAATATATQVSFQLAYDGGYTKYFRDNAAAQAAVKNLRDLQGQMARASIAGDNPERYSLKPKIAAAFAGLALLRTRATNYWQTFTCPTYHGPAIVDVVAACNGPDGSYWVAQSGQGHVPNSKTGPAVVAAPAGVWLRHPTGGASTVTGSRGVTVNAATGVALGVNPKGEAMLSYTSGGKIVHVLAWGREASVGPPKQVKFTLAYDGGYTKYFRENPVAQAAIKNLRDLQRQMARATAARDNPQRYSLKPRIAAAYATNYWQTCTCPPYDGPTVADMVIACKAPDGSYWAIQSWDRDLPDYGVTPTEAQSQIEVHLAHWTGQIPTLTVVADWAYGGQWNHLWGTYTYNGGGIHGYKSTSRGVPLDLFGRNLYVDTYDSAYGRGWWRENGFLTHNPGGTWCYSVNPHGSHPAGTGSQYRLTILGLGVTPDVSVIVPAPGPYDKAGQAADHAALRALHDPLCIPH